MHTPEQIKEAITNIGNLPTEDIVHQWKCALSVKDTKTKKLYKPFLDACTKELKARAKPIKDEQEPVNE